MLDYFFILFLFRCRTGYYWLPYLEKKKLQLALRAELRGFYRSGSSVGGGGSVGVGSGSGVGVGVGVGAGVGLVFGLVFVSVSVVSAVVAGVDLSLPSLFARAITTPPVAIAPMTMR